MSSRNPSRYHLTALSGFTTNTWARRDQTRQEHPEHLIQGVQSQPWVFALEHADLLTQGQNFQSQTVSRAKEGRNQQKRVRATCVPKMFQNSIALAEKGFYFERKQTP